jgi:tRNA pseudouridine38-40 synthase
MPEAADAPGGRRDRRRIALRLEYDGTAYCGSQYQDNGPSIQSVLEVAINNLTGEAVRVAFAGRTDAGVHAVGQVVAFDTSSTLASRVVQGGLNHLLPEDVAVTAVATVDNEFDPRRHATNRSYRYVIENRGSRPALDRRRAWHVPEPLDQRAMADAAGQLVGEHDFAAFSGKYEGETRRTLRHCEVHRAGDRLTVEMEAQAFLPHQVRRTVGPLVEVGLGRMREAELVTVLQRAAPSSAGPAAPAHGLYLVSVAYDVPVFEREDDG